MSSHRLWVGDARDVAMLAKLQATSLPDAWPAEAFASLLARFEVFVLLAARTIDHAAEGLILVRAAAGEAEVLTFCVAPEARRCGLGKTLLEAACAMARARGAGEMFLEVSEGNAPARALYQTSGFTGVGRRAAYYRHGPEAADAIVMRRALADTNPQ